VLKLDVRAGVVIYPTGEWHALHLQNGSNLIDLYIACGRIPTATVGDMVKVLDMLSVFPVPSDPIRELAPGGLNSGEGS